MLTLESRPTPHPQVISRIIDDEVVVVLPHQGQVKVLNNVGTKIWELLNGQRTLKEIANIIYQEYQVPIETAQTDTLAFANELAKREILKND